MTHEQAKKLMYRKASEFLAYYFHDWELSQDDEQILDRARVEVRIELEYRAAGIDGLLEKLPRKGVEPCTKAK